MQGARRGRVHGRYCAADLIPGNSNFKTANFQANGELQEDNFKESCEGEGASGLKFSF